MSSPYTQQVLKVIVAQVCQTIGWNSIQTTPLELLGDILHKYLQEVSQQTHRYSELYGRSEPNLDDVALAFRDLHINIADLDEYVSNVDPVPCAIDVPKYPVHKDNHLNFLKPGCKEVVTRPMHVGEHLPPMYPEKEDEEKPASSSPTSHGDSNSIADHMDHTKRDDHIDVTFSSPEPTTSSSGAGPSTAPTTTVDASRLRTLSETEVRLTREITSVMMTTSGFLSPAREGKLPDAKTPIIQSHFDPPAVKASTSAVASLPGVIAAAAAQSAGKDAVMVSDGDVLPSSLNATPSTSDRPEKGGKKKATDKKIAKDLFKSKAGGSPMVAPMGPPPPKQMPSMVEPLYPPSNSPMAAVVQQQHALAMSPLVCGDAGPMANVPTPKPGKKHKHKDPNKALNKSADGTKLSKKKQKKQAEKLLAQTGGNIAGGGAIGAPPMWDNKSFPGIDPIHAAAGPSYAGQQPQPLFMSPGRSAIQASDEMLPIKTERPHTPEMPANVQPMLGQLPEPIGQMSPIFNMLPAGTTGTPILHSPLPVTPTLGAAGPSGFDGGKLSSNPDKRKQNILKRISKKDAELKAMLPPNLNLPEMSIFPIIEDNVPGVQQGKSAPIAHDQPLNMSMPKTSPGFVQSPVGLVSPVPSLVALSPGFSPMQHQHPHQQPHMSMMSPQQQLHKPPMMMQQNVTPSGKAKKEPKPKKVREKKPPKPRAKKPKAGMPPDWPAGVPPPQLGLDQPMHPPPLSPFGGAAGHPANMLPSPPQVQQPTTSPAAAAAAAAAAAQKQQRKLVGHLPPTLGNIDDALNQFGPAAAMQRPDFMFPWPFSGGPSGLVPGMPGMPPVGVASGPGLIPGMPGIPVFPPFQMPGNMPPMPGHFLPGHGPFDATGKPILSSPDQVPFGFPNMVGAGELPRQKRSRVEEPNAPVAPSAVCNVAPLVPASLKLDAAAAAAQRPPIVDDDDDDDLQFVSTTPAPIVQQQQPQQQRIDPKISAPSAMQIDAFKPAHDPPAPKLLSPGPPTGGAASAVIAASSSKRRRSPSPPLRITSQPPVEPVQPQPLLPKLSGPPPIIDLDVQSISDDELPFDDDDMDLEEPMPSAPTDVAMPPLSKMDKSLLKLERKKEKELRKEGKKDKEGKIKKKKDKKDKSKGKEKSEKRKEKEDKRRDKELKEKAKKEKKEKKRALLAQQQLADGVDGAGAGSSSMDDSGSTRPGFGGNVGIGSGVSTMEHPEGAVPKLTLKLGGSPRPNTPDVHRKITIKPPKKDAFELDLELQHRREPSPELARFSALVTRPPKQKTPSTKKKDHDDKPSEPAGPIASDPHIVASNASIVATNPLVAPSTSASPAIATPVAACVPAPPTSSVGDAMFVPAPQIAAGPQPRKMNPPDGKPPKMKTAPKSLLAGERGAAGPSASPCGSASATGVQDSEGNQVWICPACGRIDDGTPMIGCDGCDAWYHWVCVGIQVAPETNEDWYCRVCIAKKQEQAGSGDKKKKRKKKDKKDH